MKRQFLILTTLFLFGLLPGAAAIAQTVTNVAPIFTCTDGKVTLTYDLDTADPTDLVLYYSHNTVDWLLAKTVTGDLNAQSTGTGKTITWDCFADNVRLGKFYFKIEAPPPTCRVKSTLTEPPYNGWITFLCYNLGAIPDMTIKEQMAYVSNGDTDATVYGDLYQWGRVADGHQLRTSPAVTGPLSGADLDDVTGQAVGAHVGKFVTNTDPISYYDWRTPQMYNLWYDNGKTANDPCPTGWRVPSSVEWQSIFDPHVGGLIYIPPAGRLMTGSGNYWKWNGNGWIVSPDGTANGTVTLFLPAAGARTHNNGTLALADSECAYFCNDNTIPVFGFSLRSTILTMMSNYARGTAFSVRCVAER